MRRLYTAVRWRWAIATVCVAAIVALALFEFLASPTPGAVAAVRSGHASSVVDEQIDAEISVQTESGAAGSAESHSPEEVHVCGGGWVKRLPDGSVDEADLSRATQVPQQAIERILSRMRSGPDELSRASALLLGMLDRQRTSVFSCETLECSAALPPIEPDVEQMRDAIVRLATSTTDPRVYGLAFKVCGASNLRNGSCRLLSAAQWARLDPDNAEPWLFVLADKKTLSDRAALDEALFRISRASRGSSGFFDVSEKILQAMPDDDASMTAARVLASGSIGMEAAVGLPPYRQLIDACKGSALQDVNRAQVCTGVAELLAERADTLLDRMMGTSIGKQVGWPEDRLDRMRGEYSAYLAHMAVQRGEGEEFECTTIRRDLDQLGRNARLGEAGALRAWIASSGKSSTEFAREHREAQARGELQVAAVKAMAAASATSR